MSMITFERENSQFNFRVAGLLFHNGRLLLHTTKQDNFWNLPGGRVEFHESSEQALVREMQEELGLAVHVDRLVYLDEAFFEYDSKQYHEIGFYYLVSLEDAEHDYFQREEPFVGLEDDGRLIFQWFSEQEISDLEVYPEILRTRLHDIMNGTEMIHSVRRK